MKKLLLTCLIGMLPAIYAMENPNPASGTSQQALQNQAAIMAAQSHNTVAGYHWMQTPEEIEELEKQGFDINSQDSNGNTVLNYAIINENCTLAWHLLTKRDIDITKPNSLGKTPLDNATELSLYPLFQVLILKKNNPRFVIDDQLLDKYWISAFDELNNYGIRYSSYNLKNILDILKTKCSKGYNPSSYLLENDTHETEILSAKIINYLSDEEFFTELKSCLTAKSNSLVTVLFKDFPHLIIPLCVRIQESGFELSDEKKFLELALKCSVLYAPSSLCEVFKIFKKYIGGTIDDLIEGYPLLYHALNNQSPSRHSILETLLEMNANPNIIGQNGYSPLCKAIETHDMKSLEMLCSYGADIEQRLTIRRQFFTPSLFAIHCNNQRALHYLNSFCCL